MSQCKHGVRVFNRCQECEEVNMRSTDKVIKKQIKDAVTYGVGISHITPQIFYKEKPKMNTYSIDKVIEILKDIKSEIAYQVKFVNSDNWININNDVPAHKICSYLAQGCVFRATPKPRRFYAVESGFGPSDEELFHLIEVKEGAMISEDCLELIEVLK